MQSFFIKKNLAYPAGTRRRFNVEIRSKCGRDVDRLNFDVGAKFNFNSGQFCKRAVLRLLSIEMSSVSNILKLFYLTSKIPKGK